MLAFNHLGRLGYLANQMFQYAAIKGIAANNKTEYIIPENNEMQLFDGEPLDDYDMLMEYILQDLETVEVL